MKRIGIGAKKEIDEKKVLKKEITELKKVNKALEDTVNALKTEKETLEKEITELKEKKDK